MSSDNSKNPNPYGPPPQGPSQPSVPNPYGESTQPGQPGQLGQPGQPGQHFPPGQSNDTRQFGGPQQPNYGQPYNQDQAPNQNPYANQPSSGGQHYPSGQHYPGGQQFNQPSASPQYGFAGAPGASSSSAGTTTSGSNMTVFIVIGVLVVLTIIALIASFALFSGGNDVDPAAGSTTSSPASTSATGTSEASSTRQTETSSAQKGSTASSEPGEIVVDDTTGQDYNSMIMGIELSDEMKEHVDADVFADVTLDKFKEPIRPGMSYGVSAVMVPDALDNPEKLVEAINKLTSRYCFFGFDAEGTRRADTRIGVDAACQEETDVEEFVSVINAVRDHDPFQIQSSAIGSHDYRVSFNDVNPDTIEQDYGNLRAPEGVRIRVAFIPSDPSDFLWYTLTSDGLVEDERS